MSPESGPVTLLNSGPGTVDQNSQKSMLGQGATIAETGSRIGAT